MKYLSLIALLAITGCAFNAGYIRECSDFCKQSRTKEIKVADKDLKIVCGCFDSPVDPLSVLDKDEPNVFIQESGDPAAEEMSQK